MIRAALLGLLIGTVAVVTSAGLGFFVTAQVFGVSPYAAVHPPPDQAANPTSHSTIANIVKENR